MTCLGGFSRTTRIGMCQHSSKNYTFSYIYFSGGRTKDNKRLKAFFSGGNIKRKRREEISIFKAMWHFLMAVSGISFPLLSAGPFKKRWKATKVLSTMFSARLREASGSCGLQEQLHDAVDFTIQHCSRSKEAFRREQEVLARQQCVGVQAGHDLQCRLPLSKVDSTTQTCEESPLFQQWGGLRAPKRRVERSVNGRNKHARHGAKPFSAESPCLPSLPPAVPIVQPPRVDVVPMLIGRSSRMATQVIELQNVVYRLRALHAEELESVRQACVAENDCLRREHSLALEECNNMWASRFGELKAELERLRSDRVRIDSLLASEGRGVGSQLQEKPNILLRINKSGGESVTVPSLNGSGSVPARALTEGTYSPHGSRSAASPSLPQDKACQVPDVPRCGSGIAVPKHELQDAVASLLQDPWNIENILRVPSWKRRHRTTKAVYGLPIARSLAPSEAAALATVICIPMYRR